MAAIILLCGCARGGGVDAGVECLPLVFSRARWSTRALRSEGRTGASSKVGLLSVVLEMGRKRCSAVSDEMPS